MFRVLLDSCNIVISCKIHGNKSLFTYPALGYCYIVYIFIVSIVEVFTPHLSHYVFWPVILRPLRWVQCTDRYNLFVH